MKSLCRLLASITLIGGIIASIITANVYGRVIEYERYGGVEYVRKWGLTVGIFVGCLFVVVAQSVILFALAEILENQEAMKRVLDSIPSSNSSRLLNAGDWSCKCDRIHPAYETSCPVCKQRKN